MQNIKLLPETNLLTHKFINESGVSEVVSLLAQKLSELEEKLSGKNLKELKEVLSYDEAVADYKQDQTFSGQLSFINASFNFLQFALLDKAIKSNEKIVSPEVRDREAHSYRHGSPASIARGILEWIHDEKADTFREILKEHKLDDFDFTHRTSGESNDHRNIALLLKIMEVGDAVRYIPEVSLEETFEYLEGFFDTPYEKISKKAGVAELITDISSLARSVHTLLLSNDQDGLKALLMTAKEDLDAEEKERGKLIKREHYSMDINPLTGEEIPHYKPKGEFAEKLDLYRDTAMRLRQLVRMEIPEDEFQHGQDLDHEIAMETEKLGKFRAQVEPLLDQIHLCENIEKSLRDLALCVEYGVMKDSVRDTQYVSMPNMYEFLDKVMSENINGAYDKAYYNVLWRELGRLEGADQALAYRFNGVVNVEGLDLEEGSVTINVTEPSLEQKTEQLEGVLNAIKWTGVLPQGFPNMATAQNYITACNNRPYNLESRGSKDRPVDYDLVQTPKNLYERISDDAELVILARNFTAQIAEFSVGKTKDVLLQRVRVMEEQIMSPLMALRLKLSEPFGEAFFTTETAPSQPRKADVK